MYQRIWYHEARNMRATQIIIKYPSDKWYRSTRSELNKLDTLANRLVKTNWSSSYSVPLHILLHFWVTNSKNLRNGLKTELAKWAENEGPKAWWKCCMFWVLHTKAWGNGVKIAHFGISIFWLWGPRRILLKLFLKR